MLGAKWFRFPQILQRAVAGGFLQALLPICRAAKAGIQRRRRIAQHRQYFPPAGAQADDLRQNRFKCAKAAAQGKHHRARRFQAGIHQLTPLSLRAVAARSCKITSTVCATSAPAVSGAQRAGRLKACSARQAQFPRGGKIRSAGAAGKVQDQRPPGQAAQLGRPQHRGRYGVDDRIKVRQKLFQRGQRCGMQPRAARCGPLFRRAGGNGHLPAQCLQPPATARPMRPYPNTRNSLSHIVRWRSCISRARHPSAVGTAFRQASSGRKK